MKIFLGLLFIFIIICIVSWIVDTHRFVVRNYDISSSLIKKDMRAVLLTDLHNNIYGNDNDKLIEALKDASPDIILIGGDLIDGIAGHDFMPGVRLLDRIKDICPIYYGMGNHEYRLGLYPDEYGTMWDEYCEAIGNLGLHVMDNERVFLDEYGCDIAGLSIGREFYKRFRHDKMTGETITGYLGDRNPDAFTLLIAHNPEYFDAYAQWGAELTVSGHVHGGIMRLPFIGGIVSPRLIDFPRYSGGLYTKDGKSLIVSCGMGMHTLKVRVFNPAELSVIDIHKI